MSRPEYLRWVNFYRLHPFNDEHRHLRPAAMIAQAMAGGRIEDYLERLQPPEIPDGMSLADYNTLRAFGIDPTEEST